MQRSWLLAAYFCLLLLSHNALAFGDDLCFRKVMGEGQSKVSNCLVITEPCRDAKTGKPVDTKACRLSLIKHVITLPGNMEGSRSMLHTDATYFIAQALGYTPDDAYQIISYNQATDLGVYQPYDQRGVRLISAETCQKNNYASSSCRWVSRDINGFVRLNFSTGGHLLHLPARGYTVNELSAEPALIPFPYNYLQDREHEWVLAHYYDWTYDKIPSVCVAGITKSGTVHKAGDGQPLLCATVEKFPKGAEADWKFPVQLEWDLIGEINPAWKTRVLLGEQVLREDAKGDPLFYSHDLAQVVGEKNAPLAKLGIFLHLLQDRYSHHMCSDRSVIRQKEGTGVFTFDYDPEHCGQGAHLIGHLWEIGVPHNDVAPEFRTIAPALDATYDSLLEYGKTFQRLTNKPIALSKEAITVKVSQALAIEDPNKRLAAMTALFKEYKLQPLPGHD